MGTPIAVDYLMAQLRQRSFIGCIQVGIVVLVSTIALACGESANTSPTAPTPPPTTTTPPPAAPPPSSGCRPNTPTGLSVSSIGSRVTITWSAVANVTDYEIIIGTGPANSDVLFANTSQPTYNWNGGAQGTYYTRVGARNSCGSSATSSPVQFTISPN